MHIFVNYYIEDWINLILNILTSAGTIAAVFVAIHAIKQSNQQLQSALKTHEQSKSIDLFDKRVKVIEEIDNYGVTSFQSIKLLFNSNTDIINRFERYKETCMSLNEAITERNEYLRLTKKEDGEGGFFSEEEEKIHEYERKIKDCDYSESIVNEFIEYCNDHTYQGKDENSDEMKTYNYYEINQKIELLIPQKDKQKAELLAMLERFVEESIKPLV